MNKNYIPLYRKYRPQTIEQIVGQEHIKKALANAISMNRISHAYLFTGPRGTGKTSTARIFAKSLNCENGPTIKPCGECENCRNITNSVPIDVIEIDAASNRSVSDAEEIIQSVAMAPVHSRYKIYIIDEVHMLSTTAFNSLLKTLEEPPENVIFILATTEVHKVLDTIKSRCQRFDFKRITTDDISKHLRFISDKESINITDDALRYIAINSAGGMRDSIALLDQLSVLSSDSAIGVEDINRLLGRLSFGSLTQLFEAISKSNQNDALDVLNEIYNQGNEPSQILSNLLEYFRNALIIKSVNGQNTSNIISQLNEEQIKILTEKLQNIEVHQLVSLIDKCANYIKELKLTSNPKLWLDVAILDLSNLVQNTKLEDLEKRLSMLEGGHVQVQPVKFNKPEVKTIQTPEKNLSSKIQTEETGNKKSEISAQQIPPKQEKQESVSVPMSAPKGGSIDSIWTNFLDSIKSFPTKAILKQQAIPVKLTSEEVIITIKAQDWLKKFSPEGEKYGHIINAAKTLFGSEPKVIIRAPMAGDAQLKSASAPKLTQVKSEQKDITNNADQNINQDNQNVSDNLEDENILNEEVQETISETVKQQTPQEKRDNSFHSDNVNMVMDLFEGKIIE